MTGTVKNIQADRRFGFLRDQDGQDRFFHAKACADFDALQRGDAVDFEHEDGEKGLRAKDVRKVSRGE